MPTLTAFQDHPTHPYVRLEANWADTPSVESVCVYRVNKATGERKALRSYVCSDDDGCLVLSCGHGTWWDTEAPLDTEIYYIAESAQAPCLFVEPVTNTLISDTFERTLSGEWGTADSGQPWEIVRGDPASFSVGTGQGTIERQAAGSYPVIAIVQDQLSNVEILSTISVESNFIGIVSNVDIPGQNWYEHVYDSSARLSIWRITAGTGPRIAGYVPGPAFVANQPYKMRVQVTVDGVHRMKVWVDGSPEPAVWMLEVEDDTHILGGAGAFSDTLTGDTGNWDDYTVTSECAQACTPVTVQTAPLTVPSNGMFWLSDPVRPCHDRPIVVCVQQTRLNQQCGGTGIQFLGIGTELYGSNGFRVRPAQRRRPIAITRPRRDAATVLRLLTSSFQDREDLLQLVIPGSPLLFRGPPAYGVPDRYMDIETVGINPSLPDLRYQARTETLPYETVNCPAGPTQGICGNRVQDLCDVYSSWDEMADAGLTWDDLLTGRATNLIMPRTWDDVQAEFADWDAVEANGTWTELQVGD